MSAPDKRADDPARRGWQSPEQAAKYRESRQPSRFHRFQREEKIVRKWLGDLRPGALVIDVPCGAGRWVPTVAELGLRYVGGDISRAMIGEALKSGGDRKSILGFANADAERLPFSDNSADCVILWRLLHHVRDEHARQAMLREAARVSNNKVLVSFHHPLSLTYARKFIQRMLFGRAHGQSITHWRLKREAEQCGLRLAETCGFRKFVSINWFACLIKRR